MIGELSIGGVFLPPLLLFALAAVVLTAVLSRLFSILGFYRVVGSRPLTDVALFLLLLAAITRFTEGWGLRA